MVLGLDGEICARTLPVCLARTSEQGFKSGHHNGVELSSYSLIKARPRDTTWHGISVWPTGGHGVICVCNGDDARSERDGLDGETVGITVPIDPFVMMPNDRCDLGVVVNSSQDAFANDGVLLHLPPLVKRERARLFKNARRKPYLADVMKEAG